MNFFDHQDAARRSTRRLLVLFTLAIVLVVALIYVPVALAMAAQAVDQRGGRITDHLWEPALAMVVAVPVVLVILLGAGVKRIQLRGGGRAVAESLGGRWLQAAGASPAERRLLDTVEEMAIASGMPVPPVCVIPDDSINAFAAGRTPTDAVLGFTRGAIERLPREELQGVVAHEFSHVAHGDMRLNIRLACAVAGVMAIVLIGRALVHMAARMPKPRRSKDDGRIGLVLVGVGLMAVGGLGALFGRLLQAAVSRQREFLADASAAQYTRHPAALAAALRRIAAEADNRMQAEAASGLNHFFFTSAVRTWLATHPPITERVRRLEGSAGAVHAGISGAATQSGSHAAGASLAVAGLAGAVRPATTPTPILAATPPLSAAALDHAHALLHERLPHALLQAVHEPLDAQALLLLLCESGDPAVASRQQDLVRQALGVGMAHAMKQHRAAMQGLDAMLRLTVMDLCLPRLESLSRPQYLRFRECLAASMRADGSVSLLEWMLRTALARRVEVRHGAQLDRHGRATLASVRHDVVLLLSALARSGASGMTERAMRRGLQSLGWKERPALDANACSLDAVDAALERLATLREGDRHRLVDAAEAVVRQDGVTAPNEAMLLRAICDRVGVMAPLAQFA
jgi:Zn-dependent protease with chaperone function